jgi:hypothetical protein
MRSLYMTSLRKGGRRDGLRCVLCCRFHGVGMLQWRCIAIMGPAFHVFLYSIESHGPWQGLLITGVAQQGLRPPSPKLPRGKLKHPLGN